MGDHYGRHEIEADRRREAKNPAPAKPAPSPDSNVKELLRKLEWSGRTQGQGTSMGANNGSWYSSCPICRGLKGKPNEFVASAWGHKQGCELMEALVEGPAWSSATRADPDDIAVDQCAVAMKAKLAKKRAEGRSGWDDKENCSQVWLSTLLREHVEKGDPLDVANLAMMLWARGESVSSLIECLEGE